MLTNILAFGAVVGGIIGISAYIPQFIHLIKVKESTGISVFAWWMWFCGNFFLLAYALNIGNIPYTIVEVLACSANILMITLTYKYK